MRNILKNLKSFACREEGTATIESVIWLPVYVGLFCLMTDVALIFNGQTLALRTLQDANRSLSVGRLDNEDELATYLAGQLASLSPNAKISAVIDSGSVTSTLTIPTSDLAATGWFSGLTSIDLVVSSEHIIEY